jgi:hypothetical protein
MSKRHTQLEQKTIRLLRKHGVRHYDKLIHDQDGAWLVENFGVGRKYPVNVSKLMRNIIWQVRERIQAGEKPPLKELVRTFWYMYIKPTLSRAGSLADKTDQYKQLSEQLVFMVTELDIMRYADIGFRDDNQAHRHLGANANIVLFSEKLGHQAFLSEMADKYDVSILALGGQPSVVNVEYFVDSLKAAGVNLKRSFYLFSIVDYDPSGWIVRDAFVNDLHFYGIKNIRMVDLITPDMLTPEEVRMSRYKIPAGPDMRVKNATWIDAVRKRKFQNQKLLAEKKSGRKILYGLEAESISGKRMATKLEKVMVPLVGKSEDLLKIYELRKLDEAIKELILHRVA